MSYHRNYAKPENALKRADELMGVGNREAAIRVLHDILVAKKYRPWEKALEEVCVKYVGLCVLARDARMGKDGLYQFRVNCQPNNFASLEIAIRHFLDSSEQRIEKALSDAARAAELIEKADKPLSPEEQWLLAATGEGPVDRSDREHITPWLKFLWEAYRTTLDLLKTNAKLEKLYHETVGRALVFCAKHERKPDFRRLSEMLRSHLAQMMKMQHQGVNISAPETLQLHIETRFRQLGTAIKMELWQESYKSIEDVNQLFSFSKRAIKPQVQATFYGHLADVFRASKEPLYHAASIVRAFVLSKGALGEEQSSAATVAVLAYLATPLESSQESEVFDDKMQKALHLSSLIGFRTPITRSMVSDEVKSQVLPHASEDARKLFHVMESKFHPTKMAALAAPLIESVVPERCEYYRSPLLNNVFVRAVLQMADVYEEMLLSKLQEAIPFLDKFALEHQLVLAVKEGRVRARLDFLTGSVRFGGAELELSSTRGDLVKFAKQLRAAVKTLCPSCDKSGDARAQAVDQAKLNEVLEAERTCIMSRKSVIEERKHAAEQAEQQKKRERDAEQRARRQKQLEQSMEQRRIKEQWELEQKKRIDSQIAVQENRQPTRPPWAEEAARQAAFGASAKKKPVEESAAPAVVPGLGQEETATPLQKLKEQQEEAARIAKEKEKLQNKLQNLARTMRFTQRAERMKEVPKIEAWFQEYIASEKQQHEDRIAQEKEMRRRRHEFQLLEKKRLEKMQPFRTAYEEQLQKNRKERFEKLKAEQDERLAPLRAQIQKEKNRLDRIKAEEERKRKEAEERRNAQREEKERRIQEMERERLAAEARKMEERERRKAEQLSRASGGSNSWGARAEDEDEEVGAPSFNDSPAPATEEPRASKWGGRAGREPDMRDEPAREPAGSKWGRGPGRGPEREPERMSEGRPERDGGSRWGRGPARDQEREPYREPERDGGRWGRGPPREDREPERDGGGSRWGRGPPREDRAPERDGGSRWGRGGGDGGSRYGRDDAGAPPRDAPARESRWGRGGGGSGGDDRGEPRSGGSKWGRDARREDSEEGARGGGASKWGRGGDGGGSKWGRGGSGGDVRDDGQKDDDGFTTVQTKKRGRW